MFGLRRATWASVVIAALFVTVTIHFSAVFDFFVRDRWGPLWQNVEPRVSAMTPVSVVLAILLVGLAPHAHRLSWRGLLATAFAANWVWTMVLALVDGRDGISATFTRPGEYLADAREVTSMPGMVEDFIDRIPGTHPDNWSTHVAGHPPGALLFFVGLVRLGITDPFDVGLVALTIGTTAVVAVLVALRALAGEELARTVLPFLVVGPSAIWVAVSADAVFLAVTAWGIAALALAATAQHPSGWRSVAWALLAGLLLGLGIFLSYGLVLMGATAIAVLVAARNWRPLPWAVLAALAVTAAFALAGFAWWEAYPVLHDRYYAGIASERPYSYWVWGNIGAWLIGVGLAVAAGVAHAISVLRRRGQEPIDAGRRAVLLLGGSGLACVLLATVSGMSKAEVERIWLPFSPWALCLMALLPVRDARLMLVLQAVLGLVTQHLLELYW